MSATTIDELQVLISANAAAFQREMKNVRAELGQIGRSAKESTGSVAGGFIKAQLALGGLKAAFGVISSVAQKGIKEFGSLEQNLGGAEAVFGQFSDTVKQAAKDSAKTMGTSMSQYLGSANKMGSLFQGAGLSVSDSMQMTTTSMQRAADVASVMGISQEMALESIAGMAKGNFTMMDNLGVAMNDMTLAAYMLERGISGNVNQMAIGEKVGIAYQMFMDRTSKYAGNFTRESMTLEGSLAIMRAELSNVAATLGMAFAPMVSSAASFVSNVLVPAINAVIPYIVALGNIINQVAASVFSFIGGIFGASKGISGVGSSSKSASNAMKNLGASAGGAGGGMGGAAKGAKALKKELTQLAKFDEMNVLKSPEEPSGGSGGSGGGGGAPALEMPEMNFGKFNSGFDEISAKAKKIADEIKKFFSEMFDFKKIGGAFKRFWDDIVKAGKPVFEVIGSAWNKYLKPIISWAGNELLPSFLNVLGGAARFVGVAFKAAYDIATPFIDTFLAPLAKFAGGVIVGFLNGIGNAFRSISENKGLVEFLTGTAMAIGGLAVAIKTASAIQNFNSSIKTMQALMFSSPQAFSSMVASLGATKAAFVAAGGGIAGVKAAVVALGTSIKTSVVGAFNAVMAHPLVLAVVGIAAGIAFIGGSIKSAFEQGNPALWESEARTKALQKSQEGLKAATEGVKTAEENLKNARESAVNAEIAHTEAIKQKEQAQQTMKELLDQMNISEDQRNAIIAKGAENYAALNEQERQIYDAHLQIESANSRVETSQSSLNDAVAEAKTKTEELKKAKDEELAQRMADATSQAVIQGKYKNSTEAIEALKNGTLQYKDENGKMVTANIDDINRLESSTKDKSKEIVKTYQDSKSGVDQGFFGPMGRSLAWAGDQLGKFAGWAGQKFGEFIAWAKKAGQDAWNGITSTFSNIGKWFGDRWNEVKNAFSNAWQVFSDIGRNIWNGLRNGIGNIANNMKNMFAGAVDNVKKFLGIHSPSRLFMGLGGFVGEGFAIGISDEQKTVMNALSGLTSGFEAPTLSIRTDFSNMKVADLPDVSDLSRKIQQDFEVSSGLGDLGEKLDRLNEKPQQIVVKIGEEKLVDKLINGINENSFLRNESMINL